MAGIASGRMPIHDQGCSFPDFANQAFMDLTCTIRLKQSKNQARMAWIDTE